MSTPPHEHPSSPLEFEDLRQVVRRVVWDKNEREEVLQDVALEFLQRPPANTRALEAWLRIVARNALAKRRRSERSRAHRERLTAAPRAETSPLESIERKHESEVLWARVRALGDPYATLLRLHFLEGHSREELARITGRSASTIRSQLKRGLDRLRVPQI